ncbi:hypothetical protein BWR19_02960 [Halomonas sp. 1513]|nr:diguanylate cyclase [Halomonas sp. 1513]APX91992.1 hypothetical protein BWR19_02960 [Halomonas sp. 1513]
MKKAHTHRNLLSTQLNILLAGTIFALAMVPLAASVLTLRDVSHAASASPPGLETTLSIAFLGGIALVLMAIVRPLYKANQALEERLLTLKRDNKALEGRNRLLEHQVRTDGLLEITNRRELERLMALEWKRANRDNQPLTLLLIDVDHFKSYNDSYGHLQGDACLKRVARTLKKAIARPTDVVARFGGEEFAILLPNTQPSGGLEVAQRVHDGLASRAAHFADAACAVTVSIGVASMTPGHQDHSHDLIQLADTALYAAKQNGRNRTESVQTPAVPATAARRAGAAAPQPQGDQRLRIAASLVRVRG